MRTRRRSTAAHGALGALGGLAAAAAGLGTAELIASTSDRLQSPVLDVADRVVDAVPVWLTRQAIEWFGTNHKTALLVGIGTLLALYAALLGILALRRNAALALAGVALFGAVGAYASQSTRRTAELTAVVPSLVGAVVAGVALHVLHRVARTVRSTAGRDDDAGTDDDTARSPTGREGDTGTDDVDDVDAVDTNSDDTNSDDTMHQPDIAERDEVRSHATIAELVPNDRRRFLAAAGLFAAGGVITGITGRRLSTSTGAAESRAAVGLPRAASPLPPAPAGTTVDVPGVTRFFTPNDNFFRIDTALTVPQVAADSWRLDITGMVDRPFSITYEELLDRELVEADITLTCVSNEVGGNLVGTARWLGVRLDDLLAEAGIDPDADQIVGRSVDGYTCGFPVATLDGRDALVAIGMNGDPLPLQHGFPARLVTPGLYGYVSATKWLREIELTRFARFDQYWVERGWAEEAPIKIQSRIDTPRGLDTVDPGTVAVAGVAWAQTRGIERVEVQIDDGAWEDADLADELNDVTWRQWSYRWEATSGRHTIRVRATERNGPIQTAERVEPFPSGATGQHQIVVMVR